MSEIDDRFVKRGQWTNIQGGSVLGQTITTDTRTGIIIVALLAVLSTIGTSHMWNLALFVYHQARATRSLADGLFRQQQAILRTTPRPSTLMAESIKMWWAWRKQNRGALARSLCSFLPAALCTIGFAAVSVSSSFVVTTSDLVVLVQSPLCGFMKESMPHDTQRSTISAVAAALLPYARACYDNRTSSTTLCSAFVHTRIPFWTENASCPFSSELCVGNEDNSTNVVAFDSGLVDIGSTFGLNLMGGDDVQYRRRSTCSILSLNGYNSVLEASSLSRDIWGREAFPGEEALVMHYGTRPNLGQLRNLTFILSLLQNNVTAGYNLAFYSPARERDGLSNTFEPSAGLRRKDADLTLVGLISSVEYSKPVRDPWFSATQPQPRYDVVQGSNRTNFVQDSPLRAMGCIAQHQFCIKTGSGDKCSQLDSLPRSVNSTAWPETSLVQLSILRVMVNSLKMYGLVQSTEVQAEQMVLYSLVTNQIPSDQWIVEARAMESAVWASMQVLMSDYAVGPSARLAELANYTAAPETAGDKQLCGSQKMRKTGGFVNINVFGMVFIIVLSLTFAIVDLILLRFLIYLSSFRQALSPRIDIWIQDSVLQLQRRAYQAIGEGIWSDLNKDIPLTAPNEMLSALSSKQQGNIMSASSVATSTSPSSPPSPRPASSQVQSPNAASQPGSPHPSSTPPNPVLISQAPLSSSSPLSAGAIHPAQQSTPLRAPTSVQTAQSQAANTVAGPVFTD